MVNENSKMLLSKPAAASLAALLLALAQPVTFSLAAETDTVVAADTTSTDGALALKASYQQRIAELQAANNQGGAILSEAWLGLGTALQALDEDNEAITAFGEALQALRVANGLHDAGQLPVLQHQLESQEKLQNWEAVDATLHLMHYIATRQFAPGAAPRFDAVLALARWKQRATEEKLLSETLDPAAEASMLYANEIKHLQALPTASATNLQLATLHLDLATVEFLLARTKWAQPLAAYGMTGPSTVQQQQCQTVRLADGRTSSFCTVQEVPNLNYYQGPTSNKNLDVGGHLVTMEQAVMEAYKVLRSEPASLPERDALQARMNQLATEYNHFIEEASPRTGTLLRP